MNEGDLERIGKTIDANHEWPGIYLFKFIVPSDNEKIAKVEAMFNTKTSEIRLTQSKNGKYTSISAREVMISAEAVMEYYRRAGEIEGLIAL